MNAVMKSEPEESAAATRLVVLVPTHWEAIMGGAQYQAQILVEYLIAKGGHDITYAARRIDEAFAPEGYAIRKIGNSQGIRFALDSRSLYRALVELAPDVIYHQVGSAYTAVAAYYCKRHNCRLVWHVASDIDLEPLEKISLSPNGLMHLLDKKLLEYGLRNADHIVVQTESQATLLRENYGRDADSLVRNFHPAPKERIERGAQPRITWIANLKRVKQPEVFFRLAEDLADTDARFVVMGGTQVSETWGREMRDRMEALDNLDYLGELTQDEVNAELARGHLLVNTSVYEGFSNTFIQAWMREVPVVSLNVDPDAVFAEHALGACADGDYDTLVQKVRRFIEDEAERASVGERCARYAFRYHSEDNVELMARLL